MYCRSTQRINYTYYKKRVQVNVVITRVGIMSAQV
jgi:hypothetical protein